MRSAFAELLRLNVGAGLRKLLSGDQSASPIRCAVADFKVSDGVATARTLVIDTGVVLAQGSGTIDLGEARSEDRRRNQEASSSAGLGADHHHRPPRLFGSRRRCLGRRHTGRRRRRHGHARQPHRSAARVYLSRPGGRRGLRLPDRQRAIVVTPVRRIALTAPQPAIVAPRRRGWGLLGRLWRPDRLRAEVCGPRCTVAAFAFVKS